jgi:putative intracellular protease/amidase
MLAEALDAIRIAGAAEREQHRRDPALAKRVRHRKRHGATAGDDADRR